MEVMGAAARAGGRCQSPSFRRANHSRAAGEDRAAEAVEIAWQSAASNAARSVINHVKPTTDVRIVCQ